MFDPIFSIQLQEIKISTLNKIVLSITYFVSEFISFASKLCQVMFKCIAFAGLISSFTSNRGPNMAIIRSLRQRYYLSMLS